MPLDPKQERFLRRFFPGLIEAVQALGGGNFTPEYPESIKGPGGLIGLSLHLTYILADGQAVELKISSRIKPGAPAYNPIHSDLTPIDHKHWDRIHYALNYGPPRQDCVFRFDRDIPNGYHVHLRHNPAEHVPCSLVEPDVRNIDPVAFVAMVAAFRRDGTYPVKRKKS